MQATLAGLKTFLGISDTVDDAVLQQSLDAAGAYVYTVAEVPDPLPADVVEALFLLAARWLARRNSPDGLVGLGTEFGPARIAGVDKDVQALLAPYARLPVWA